MPSSPDPRPPVFFEILCGLLLSSANKYDRMVSAGLGHVFPFSIPTHRVQERCGLLISDRSFFFEILCADCYSAAPPMVFSTIKSNSHHEPLHALSIGDARKDLID